MRLRSLMASLTALFASFSYFSTATLASSLTNKAGFMGHVRYIGSKHSIKQPPAPQAISYLNVRDFGAVGDGVTDDTAPIQNALNTAQNTGQGVFFPAGTYLHTTTLTANSVSIQGAGGASTLLANNPNASALILTGFSPSIQNMVISSTLAGNNSVSISPPTATLAVAGSQNFVVQGLTIVQGASRPGLLLQQVAVGQVSGVTFDGTGTGSDFGLVMDACINTSVIGNLFNNEGNACYLTSSTGAFSQSIAIIGNTFKNTASNGIWLTTTTKTFDIQQNQIEMQFGAVGVAINLGNPVNGYVQGNYIYNGFNGMVASTAIAGASVLITQNVIRNCGGPAIAIITSISTGSNIQYVANQIGECGLLGNLGVIVVTNPEGPNAVSVVDNVYQGHTNALTSYIHSNGPIGLLSGNIQTQTALPNTIF